jgi:hypothetical protein
MTFRGGQDRPHKKTAIPLPRLEPELVAFMGQLTQIHKEFGMEGARKFLAKTEEIQGLKPGELTPMLALLE